MEEDPTPTTETTPSTTAPSAGEKPKFPRETIVTKYANEDWSRYQSVPGAGLVPIRVKIVLHEDGTEVHWVIDKEGKQWADPIRTMVNEDRRKAYEAEQRQKERDAPPGGVPVKNVNGRMMRWNPKTQEYDIPTGEEPARAPRITTTQVKRGGKTYVVRIEDDNGKISSTIFDPDTGQEVPAASLPPEDAAKPEERVNPADPTRMQKWNPRTGAWEDAGANVRGIREAEDRKKPVATSIQEDENGFLISIAVMPDGKPVVTPVTENGQRVRKTTPRVTVDGVIYERGPDGKYAPLPGIPRGGEPSGAPTGAGAYGSHAQDLAEYVRWVEEKVRGGELTRVQADNLIERRRKEIELQIKEQEGVVGTQVTGAGQGITQRGQTINERENLRTLIDKVNADTLATFLPLAKLIAPGAAEILNQALQATMDYRMNELERRGLLRPTPEVQYGPAAQTAMGAQMPGGRRDAAAPGARPSASAEPVRPEYPASTSGPGSAPGRPAPPPTNPTEPGGVPAVPPSPGPARTTPPYRGEQYYPDGPATPPYRGEQYYPDGPAPGQPGAAPPRDPDGPPLQGPGLGPSYPGYRPPENGPEWPGAPPDDGRGVPPGQTPYPVGPAISKLAYGDPPLGSDEMSPEFLAAIRQRMPHLLTRSPGARLPRESGEFAVPIRTPPNGVIQNQRVPAFMRGGAYGGYDDGEERQIQSLLAMGLSPDAAREAVARNRSRQMIA